MSTAPTTIVTSKTKSLSVAQNSQNVSNNKLIWKVEEIPTEDALIDLHDKRPQPRYEFSYKQIVGTEDTILGLNEKTPSSSDCSHLVVKVHFPDSNMKDLDLDVTSNRLKVSSRNLKLFTYLPQKVDDVNGSAKFDPKSDVLTITLPIIYDE
jgi:hypothetical protein